MRLFWNLGGARVTVGRALSSTCSIMGSEAPGLPSNNISVRYEALDAFINEQDTYTITRREISSFLPRHQRHTKYLSPAQNRTLLIYREFVWNT